MVPAWSAATAPPAPQAVRSSRTEKAELSVRQPGVVFMGRMILQRPCCLHGRRPALPRVTLPAMATSPPPISWDQPYPSQRSPVLAQNVVSTTQPLAAQVGLQVLREGGNAVDAAVATAACMTVMEPINNAIGSD